MQIVMLFHNKRATPPQDQVKVATTTPGLGSTAAGIATSIKTMPGVGKPVYIFASLSQPPNEILSVDFSQAYTVTGNKPVDEAAIQAMIDNPTYDENVITWSA